MESVTGNPEVADAAFWGAGTYRSGGVDWREFLDIDDGEDPGFAEPAPPVPASDAPVAATAVELASRRDELHELAATAERSDAFDSTESTESEAFGSWSASPDDLLPFR
jgi:hypothetical protein